MSKRSRAKQVKSLHRARKQQQYVWVTRHIKKADRLEGHVVSVGRRWALLAIPTDGAPDGYAAVRVRDVKRVSWAVGGIFIRKSLQMQDAWPPVAPGQPIELDGDLRSLITSVAAASPLVTIHPELIDPDVCFIGRPIRWGRRKLHLQEVGLEGRWEDFLESHLTKTITRVDFGRVYETNLARVAGERPPG